MKTFRIGNDIHVKWALVIDSGNVSLSSVDLVIELTDSLGHKTSVEHIITQNKYAEFDFFGMFQKKLGVYRLTAWINKGKIGQAVVDECDAFKLVPCSHMEEGADNNNVNTESLAISSAVALGVQGASAYEIWLRNGHEGSETDFLEWLRGGSGGFNVADGEEAEDTEAIDSNKEVQDFLADYTHDNTLKEVLDDATSLASESDIDAMFE